MNRSVCFSHLWLPKKREFQKKYCWCTKKNARDSYDNEKWDGENGYVWLGCGLTPPPFMAGEVGEVCKRERE